MGPENMKSKAVLSLHAWRKNLCGGIPALRTTTTKSATAARPKKSRDRDLDHAAFPALRLFVDEFLPG
jgi:hypothetical protein